MKRLILSALLAIPLTAAAQVSYTGGVYVQNFNSLQGTTNNTTGVTWTDNSTLPGWYSSHTTYGVTNGTMGGTAATFDGTSVANNVGLFSFGAAAGTDRALGSRATSAVAGMTNIYYGVRLKNDTAQTITAFSVMFTGEQWHKNGGTTAHTLPLQYQLGATSIAAGTWTAVTTFSSPVNTATIASLDGNAATNRRGVGAKISGISWAPGAELWIRVADGNESGNEQAMGIDDFHFIADDESGVFLNGHSSYISMGFGATTSSLTTSSFTVECRFIRMGPGVTASTGTGGITTALPLVAKGVGEGDGSNLDANYFLGIDNATGKLVADFEQQNATNNGTAYAAGQNFPVFGSTVLQNGVPYHVAATYNTATAVWKLYVNGVAETTTQTIPTFVGVAPRNDNIQGLGIGTTVNSSGARAGFFHGLIDEARIWNYARSESEIAANMDVEIASATGLLGRYGFDEGTGTSAAGTNAAGAAAPVGTLAGTVLPAWVNAKALVVNNAPTVSITAPANNASFMAPATVSITATVSDTDGSISKVEFFNGVTKIGEDTTAPYQFDWSRTNADTGTFSLTAKATDNGGAVATSAAVSVTITPNSNQPTVVTLSGPADNATNVGAVTTLSLGLADPEGDATTVTFYGRKTTPVTPGPDFTIGTLPDTQFYSQGGENGNGRGPTFAAQTQWYLDNRNSASLPNLAFISHMGDIVENGDSIPGQWLTADAAMKVIENPSTSLRAQGIPYGVTPGNHDFGTGSGTGTTTLYNQYFGTTRFQGRSYYGAGFGGNNLTSYQLFSASGLDFIAISFEYNTGAKSTYQAQLDWADALLKAHPNRRGIITTHWMLETGNPAAFSAQGANIYNDLKDNPNLCLLLGGHVAGEGRRTDTFEGRVVHTVLQDYQGRTNGGDGWLRYFIFSPANNTITAKTYRVSNPLNPAAGTFETDADSDFVLSYNLQAAVMPWTPLGTVNVAANGTTAELSWTGLEKSSDYEWYATANDGVNTAASSARRFSTAAASAPSVTLTAPLTGATADLPATIELTADATDNDGSIARVEFYAGATKLGEDSTAPYSYSWTGMGSGSYSVSATAIDNNGLATLSNLAAITVTNLTNDAPTVAITSPADASTIVANTATALTATAADTDGSVAKVEFFLATTKLGEDLTAPFSITWAGGPVGSYAFTAKATDNDGGVTTSSVVNVTTVPAAPFVSNYAQNFDSMSTTAVLPGGWQVFGSLGGSNTTWENGTGIPANTIPAGTANNTLIVHSSYPTAPTTTTSNTQGYNFAETATPTDRALGSSPTSGAGIAFQLELTNTGTQAVSAITLAYDLRRFTSVATVNHLPGLQVFYSLDEGASWTNVAELNPTVAGPTGVIVPNTVGVTNVSATAITLASSWPVGGTLRFRWIDDNAVATSPDQVSGLDNVAVVATQFITVIGAAPTVSLTAPAANSTFEFSNAIDLTADAADTDGTISKVEFYRGATKLGEDTTAPYTFSWTTASVGSHSLTARATDSDNNVASSSPRVITVIAGASGTLARGPYLNMPNHNSITVRWRSTSSVIGRVRYGLTSDNLNLFTDEVSAQTNHVVRLTGLTPLTRYYYSVGSATDALTPEVADTTSVRTAAYTIPAPTAADYTFRTAPTPGTATNTRIWVVGDCGRGSATQAAGRDAYYNWMGSRVPDLNLQLGDNAYNSGTDSEYQSGYFAMYPTIFRKMPQWSCLGNHDANNTTPGGGGPFSYPYFDMFTFPTAGEAGGVASGTEHYYSFDYGNIHFVCLDSNSTTRTVDNPATTGVNEDGPMAAWLRQDLASTTRTWIIAFFHHPPYSKGSHDSDTEGAMVEMRTNFNPILETGGVDLVLTGHSHNYERSVLLDGNYGTTGTITAAMKKNAGNGSTTGFTTNAGGVIRNAANGFTATATVAGTVIPPNGAYMKPLTGPRDHFGAVYNTAGMSGQADGGSINHSAMYISYSQVGTVNLDINGNTLVATFIQSDGSAPDNYTIIKAGAADSDGDGLTDEFELANGLNRNSATDSNGDTDGDGLNNLVEFAFGTNPGTNDTGKLEVTGGVITKRGQPDVSITNTTNGVDFKAAFCRRKDQATAGLTYTVQFSADLSTWQSSVVTPSVVADDGVYEVVTVRYPFFLNDGQKARFFRVSVTPN